MKKIIMTLALTLLLVGCGHKEPIEETVETRKSVNSQANARSAELIIYGVETAYSTAYMLNGGEPTTKQISEKFAMEGASMDSTGTIKVSISGVSCKTTIKGNVMTVSCTGGDQTKTTSDLTISK